MMRRSRSETPTGSRVSGLGCPCRTCRIGSGVGEEGHGQVEGPEVFAIKVMEEEEDKKQSEAGEKEIGIEAPTSWTGRSGYPIDRD